MDAAAAGVKRTFVYELLDQKPDPQNKSGESQPVTTVAAALPADPSKAMPPVRIHHHGKEANTVVTAASTLRISCFIKGSWVSNGRQHCLGLVTLERVQLTLGRLRSAKP